MGALSRYPLLPRLCCSPNLRRMAPLGLLLRRCIGVFVLTFAISPILCAVEAEDPAEVVAPIKVAADAKLQKDVRAAHHAWAQRVLIAPFEKRAGDEPWKKDALAFLEQAVDDLGRQQDTEDVKALAAQGQKVLDAGCREPLVRYLTARLAFRQTNDAPATTKVLEEVAKQITADRSYGAALLCFIAKDAYVVRRSTGLTGKGMEKGVGELLKKVWTDGSYGKDDDALFVAHQLDPQWEKMPEMQATAFLQFYGNEAIPEWARNTLLGSCEIRLAWEARGGGWANAVTEQGWAGFREHMGKAGAHLTEAWNQRPDQPYAPALMIRVAMGAGTEKEDGVRLWFDRTVAAQFDYLPAYSSVLWAYRPRWGGSYELMYAFGRACRATSRFDTSVPLYFRKAVQDALGEMGDRRTYLKEHPGLVRELMTLDREWMAHPGPHGTADLWRTRLAIDAWCIDDFKTLREALDKLPSGIAQATADLRELRTTASEIMADAALAETDAGKARDEAEAAYLGNDLDAAQEGFARAEKLSKGAATAWLRSRLNIVKFERALAKGDWVKVTGEMGAEWIALEGEYETKDGALFPVGNNYQGLVVHRGRVGDNFEMRGVFEVQAPSRRDQNFEVVIDYHPQNATDWMSCALYQEGGGGMIVASPLHRHYGLDQRDLRKVVTLEPSNRFFVRSQDGLVTFELNDRPLMDGFLAPENHAKRPGSQIGFASSKWATGNTTVIRDVEVRRLKAAGGK